LRSPTAIRDTGAPADDEHAPSAVCRNQSAVANPRLTTSSRAKLAPVQPRTKRFQAVNSGLAAHDHQSSRLKWCNAFSSVTLVA
jgi:hypothetical protein